MSAAPLPRIGLLGSGGAVGRAALALLARESALTLRDGHRQARPVQGDRSETVAIDAEDPAALARFCAGCAVVLNCAGPSWRIGDRVARAAAAAGADYVDAFGGNRLARLLAPWAATAGRRFVLCAGSYPGLSELLPCWLATQGFDRVERLAGFAGGREACSPAAGADLLLSTRDGFGRAGAAWDGVAARPGALTPREGAEIPGFPGRVHAQPFLSRDLERTAARLGLTWAEWYNVTPSAHIPAAIAQAGAGLAPADDASTDAAARLDAAVAELRRIAALETSGRPSYYTVTLTMSGRHAGRAVRRRLMLRADDSYRLSGAVAAQAARHLLRIRSAAGVRTAAEELDPGDVVAGLLTAGLADLTVVELPASTGDIAAERMEEGAI
ncbi:MAG: hypothetical protein RLZZ501_400 [Pseudomonadota bacterium]